jgi:hypothetical protein
MRASRTLLVLALAGLACASTPGGQPEAGAGAQRLPSTFADVYLVPIGRIPPGILQHLTAFYRETLGLEVVETRAAPFDSRVYDASRGQLIADELINLIEVWCEGLARSPNAIFVGITANDMYTIGRARPYSFAHQDRGRYAVVSSAHLGDAEGGPAELVQTRVRKLVTGVIGRLYYDLPASEDPRSVLYAQLLSIEDLDAIDESTLRRDIVEADAARFR